MAFTTTSSFASIRYNNIIVTTIGNPTSRIKDIHSCMNNTSHRKIIGKKAGHTVRLLIIKLHIQ